MRDVSNAEVVVVVVVVVVGRAEKLSSVPLVKGMMCVPEMRSV